MGHMPVANATRELNTQPKLSQPAYVVLGMVGLGARSGYEIKQTVEHSIRFFWTISQAQIYPSLQQLERGGLITGRPEPRGKRNRRVFEITDTGRTALEQWLRVEQPMPFELRDIAMVKLFFADALNSEDALALLARVKQRSEQQIATLEQIEPAAQLVEQEGNAHPLLTLHIGIAFHRAMVDVCREFEPKLAAPASS
jgi:PadR family transcriptional regulator, regulatory protein AphA